MDTKKQLKTQNPQINTEQTININAGEVADARLYHNVPLSQLDIDMVEHKNPSLASKVKGFFANALSRLGLSTTSDVTEIELEDFGGPVNAQQIERLNDSRLIDGDMSQIRLSETIPIEGRTVSSNLPTASNVTAVKTSPEIKKIELNPVVPITQQQKEYTYYQSHNCQTMASDMKACADSYADIAEAKKALVKMVRKDENGDYISDLDKQKDEWNKTLNTTPDEEIITEVVSEIHQYLFTNKSTLGFFDDYIECPEHFHRIVNIVSFLSTKTDLLNDLNNEVLSVMKDQIKNSVIFYKQSYNIDILKDSPLENDPEFKNLKVNKKQAANLHSTALKNTTAIREKLDEAYSKKLISVKLGDNEVQVEQGHLLTESAIYENIYSDRTNYAHVINNPAYFESIEHKSVYDNTDNEKVIPEYAKKDSTLKADDKKNATALCNGILKSLNTIDSYTKQMQLISGKVAFNDLQKHINAFRSQIDFFLKGKTEKKDGKDVIIPAAIREDKYFRDQKAAKNLSSVYSIFKEEFAKYISVVNAQIKRLGMPNAEVKANYEALQSFMKDEILLTQVGNLFSIAQMQMSINSPELKKHYFLDAKKLEFLIKSDVKNGEQWPIPENDKAIEIITGNSTFEKAWLIAKLLIKKDAASDIRKAVLDTYGTFSFTEKNNICRWLCVIQDQLTIDTTEIFEAPELELSIKKLKTALEDELVGGEERTSHVSRKDLKLTEFGTEEDSWAHATALMLQNYGYMITPEKVKEVVQTAISKNKISADVGVKIAENRLVTIDDIKGAFSNVFDFGVLQEINLPNHRNQTVHGKSTPTREMSVRLVKDTIQEAFKNDCVVVMYVDGHYITITDYKHMSKDDSMIRYQDSRQSGHDKKHPEIGDEISKKLSSLIGEHKNFDFADLKLYWMKKELVAAPVAKEEEQKEKKEQKEEKEKIEEKRETKREEKTEEKEQKEEKIETEKKEEKKESEEREEKEEEKTEKEEKIEKETTEEQEKESDITNPTIQLPEVSDLKYTEFQNGNDCWAYTISLQLKARGFDMTADDVKSRIIEAVLSNKLNDIDLNNLDYTLLYLRDIMPLFEAELGGKDKIHACTLVNYKNSEDATLKDVTNAAGEEINLAINQYHSPVSLYLGEHYVTITAIQKEADDYVVHYQDSLLTHHHYKGKKDPSHDNVEKLSHLIELYTSEKGASKMQTLELYWADNDKETLQFFSDNAILRATL